MDETRGGFHIACLVKKLVAAMVLEFVFFSSSIADTSKPTSSRHTPKLTVAAAATAGTGASKRTAVPWHGK